MAINVAAGWETVIGLEVHTQLSTNSKMYCACPVVNTREMDEANKYVCPVCLGHPGTLPRPNRQAVLRSLALAIKLSGRINPRNVFARKNYFYPDLPKGYQISQYDLPLAQGGLVPYWHLGKRSEARLVRMHLEEDTAKLFHQPDGSAKLDYNRAGIPLLEIVSEPDFRNAEECVSYLDELRSLLQRLGVSDAAMEAGNFRCEPNVSVRPIGSTELRTKTELKNLNSFTTLRRAVESEVARQIAVYESGGEVHQATMRYDEKRGQTVQMRIKETDDDYRYFDDPDIPPLIINRSMKLEASNSLRASAFELRQMMTEQDGINHQAAAIITSDQTLHRFYRLCCKDGHEPGVVANWVTGDFLGLFREAPLKIEPGALSVILTMLKGGELTRPQAKEVLALVYESGKSAEAVVQEQGYSAAADFDLKAVCVKVIEANAKPAADVRGGKTQAVQALVGQVMRETKGGADPNLARETLLKLLGVEG